MEGVKRYDKGKRLKGDGGWGGVAACGRNRLRVACRWGNGPFPRTLEVGRRLERKSINVGEI